MCFVGASVSAVLFSIVSVSARKGRLRLLGVCLLGVGAIVTALAMIGYQRSLPIHHGEGIIQRARTYWSGRQRRTRLYVLTSNGELVLDASGLSPFFRQSEHIIVMYKGVTGSVTSATFLKADGSVEGRFHGSGLWSAYVLLVGGILIIYAEFKRNKRDPEGAEQPYNRNTMPRTGVDTASLLQLSGKRSRDHN